MKGAIAAGHPLDGRGGRAYPRRGRQRRRRLRRRRLRLLGGGEPAHRPGRRRVHARPPGARPQRPPARLLRRRPGLGPAAAQRAEMEAIDIDFDGDTTQVFRIGTGSCAVPGAAAGLEAAHRAYGDAAVASLFEPALELARDGVELTRAAGVPARDPRPDPPPHRRGPAHLRPPARGSAPATASCSTTSATTLEELAAQGRRRDLRRLRSAKEIVRYLRDRGRRCHAAPISPPTASCGGGRCGLGSAATSSSPTRRRRRAAC